MFSTPPSLLERLRQPEQQQAWNDLVRLYTPLLCQWARRLGLADADVADLVQDVFLRLYRKLPNFVYNAEKSFRGWLRTVMLNHWRNLKSKRAEQPIDGDVNQIPAPDEHALLAEAEYRQMVIARALQLLKQEFPENVWQPFWSYAVEGQTPQEVAQNLGVTVNMVYLCKSRVLMRLRNELKGLLD